MTFIDELLEEISTEGEISETWSDFEELEQLNYSIESRRDELIRGIGLIRSIETLQERFESDTSMEAAGNYLNAVENVLLASGLDIPTTLFYSTEAEEKKEEVKKEDSTPPSAKDTDPKKDDKEEKKKTDVAVDKKSTGERVKETLKKVKDWLMTKAKEFSEWVVERSKKIAEMTKKVFSQADKNEEAFKGA